MAANNSYISYNFTNVTAFDWEPFFYADSPYRELQMVWLTACAVLGIIGNLALLVTVLCVRELRTPGNALICALAVADISQIVAKVTPSMIFLLHREPLPCDGVYVIIDTVYLVMGQFSVNIIAPISIDRYWYICFPLKYNKTMTTTRTSLLIGLSFFFAMVTMVHPLLLGMDNYFNPPFLLCKYQGPARKSRQALINICILVSLIIMLFCYYKIWRELRRRQSRHNQVQPGSLSAIETVQPTHFSLPPSGEEATCSPEITEDDHDHDDLFSPLSSTDDVYNLHQPCVQITSRPDALPTDVWLSEERSQQHRNSLNSPEKIQPQPVIFPNSGVLQFSRISPEFKARMRTATMVLLIIVTFLISWTPYFAVVIRSNALSDQVSTITDGQWQRFAVHFSLLSTFSNPIIYAYRNPQLREGFFGLLRRHSL